MLLSEIRPYTNYYKLFYLVFILLLTFCKAIGLSGDDYTYIFVFIFSLFFWALKIFNDRWTKREILVLLLFFTLSLVNFYITKEETLLLTFFVFSGMKGISIKKVFIIMLITRITGFIAVVTSAYAGLIPNEVVLFWRNGAFIERYGLGFDHPNLLHSSLNLIIILFIYLYYEKYNLFYMIVLSIINIIFYLFSFSRTGLMSISILLVITYLMKKSSVFTDIIKKVTVYIQFLLFGSTIILSVFFADTTFVKKLDDLFTGRLYYAREQLKYMPTIFGRNFGNTDILFDNSYSMLISVYGIVVTTLFLLSYYWTAKKLIKLNNNGLVMLFLIISITCFFESFMGNALMNFTIIIFAKNFFNELEEIERE
ncbi:O-antigen polymerase [Desemzia sp. FAM 23989]|uniref:O-antigen polymerase n=1 Tax=Desemzia sp. FAM 23989 TaxID=3259523 RepID=UPI00388B5586